eukprot:UN29665
MLPIYRYILVAEIFQHLLRGIFLILETQKNINMSNTLHMILHELVLEGLADGIPFWILAYFLQSDAGWKAIQRSCWIAFFLVGITSPLSLYGNTHSENNDKTIKYSCELLFEFTRWAYYAFVLPFFALLPSRRFWWIYYYTLSHLTFSTVNIVAIVFYLADYNMTGGCVNFTSDTLTWCICPLILYWSLLEDSQYWRTLGQEMVNTGTFGVNSPLCQLIEQIDSDVTLYSMSVYKVPVIDFTQLLINNRRIMGKGAYGVVFQALYKKRKVAVKKLNLFHRP